MNTNNFTFKRRRVPSATHYLFRKFNLVIIPFLLLFSIQSFAEKPAKLLIVNAKEPVLVGEGKCNAKLTILGFEINDACDTDFSKSWVLLDENKITVKNGTSDIGGSTFPASYFFTKKDFGKKFYLVYKAKDKCDNEDFKEFELLPRDMIKPKPKCHQGLSFDLMPTTSLLWLSSRMFGGDSIDECGEIIKDKITGISSINNHVKSNNVQQLGNDKTVELRLEVNAFPGPNLPNINLALVNCVGVIPVRLWAIDAAGNYDYCDSFVDVQNNMGANGFAICENIETLGPFVKGTIKSITGKPIPNSIVFLQHTNPTDPSFVVTNLNGQFRTLFKLGASFNIKPFCNEFDDPLYGVSTFDLLLIQKHILGTQPITDEFSLIAADVNNSGKISTSDIVELRKMILGIQNNFINNHPWRFFTNEMKENMFLSNLQKETNIDFTGVKIGDVNHSHTATSRAAKTHFLNIQNKDIKAGELIELALGESLEAFSFTLNYDANVLELLNLDENSANLEQGIITTAQLGTPFKAIFRAKSDALLSNVIGLNSTITHAEAVVNNEENELVLKFEWKENEATKLFQNQPNPFQDNTLINFFASEVADYELIVTNEIGQIVNTAKGTAIVGLNQVNVELHNAGTYFYSLKMKDFVATKKMIAW